MNRTTFEAQGNALVMQLRAEQLQEHAANLAVKEAAKSEETPEERYDILLARVEELVGDDGYTPTVVVTQGMPEGLRGATIRLGVLHHPAAKPTKLYPNPRELSRVSAEIAYLPFEQGDPVTHTEVVHNYDFTVNLPAFNLPAIAAIEGTLSLYETADRTEQLPLVH